MQPQQDHIWQNAVQARLERLYVTDGRTSPEHPKHGVYTGLAAKYSGLPGDSARDAA